MHPVRSGCSQLSYLPLSVILGLCSSYRLVADLEIRPCVYVDLCISPVHSVRLVELSAMLEVAQNDGKPRLTNDVPPEPRLEYVNEKFIEANKWLKAAEGGHAANATLDFEKLHDALTDVVDEN